ncbi:response regulator [bacterium]|nr:response regulator [bacterium]
MLNPEQIKVMIVDDSSFVINKLRNIAEKAKFQIVGIANDGFEALTMFKECNPDVITMDINMPNMDGLATMKLIRQMNPNIKIIMLSSMSTKDKVIEALKYGAKNFITKPFSPERVVAVITQVANK